MPKDDLNPLPPEDNAATGPDASRLGFPLSSRNDIPADEDGLAEATMRVFDSPRDGSHERSAVEGLAKQAALHPFAAKMDEAVQRAQDLSSHDPASAVAILRDAIEQFGPSVAPFDRSAVRTSLQLSRLLQTQGDLIAAERVVSDLLAANERLGGSSRYVVGLLSLQLGQVYGAQGRLEDAASAFTTAASGFLLGSGPESPDYIIANVRAAETLYALRQFGALGTRVSEILLAENGLGALPSPDWRLRAIRVTRLGGHAEDAKRWLNDFMPTVRERPEILAQGSHALAMCHWDLDDQEAAHAAWTLAWRSASKTGSGTASGAVLANMGLKNFVRRSRVGLLGLVDEARALTERDPAQGELPVLYLTLCYHAELWDDIARQWFRSAEGKHMIHGLTAAASDLERECGRLHPRTVGVRNTVAVAHGLASDWEVAARIIDELLVAGPFGVPGRDLVLASIAYNGYLANAVLGRADHARQMLARVLDSTVGRPGHHLQTLARDHSKQDETSMKPLASTHAADALIILPLSD